MPLFCSSYSYQSATDEYFGIQLNGIIEIESNKKKRSVRMQRGLEQMTDEIMDLEIR